MRLKLKLNILDLHFCALIRFFWLDPMSNSFHEIIRIGYGVRISIFDIRFS